MVNAKRAIERCEQLSELGLPPPWSNPRALQRWRRAYLRIMALETTSSSGWNDEVLRECYPKSVIQEMSYRPNPLLARHPKCST
jgi:hypothetical protein